MSAPAATWPLRRWCAAAAQQWSWRQTLLALLLGQASQVWWGMPVYPFPAGQQHYFIWGVYHTMQTGFPLVFLVSVADRAVEDGVRELGAYTLAVATTLFGGNIAGRALAALLVGEPPGWIPAENLWFIAGNVLPLGLGVAAYVQWRQERRARARIHAHQLERAQAQQQLHAAHLLALQARVEPDLLFDTLQRVDGLMAMPGAAADDLLADLIAMLRAMLPVAGARASTVAREYALLSAYARVTGAAGLQPGRLDLHMAPAAARANLAPMVLLPVLRTLTAPAEARWQVNADCAGSKLQLAFWPAQAGDGTAATALRSLDVQPLREHLRSVHGASARFEVLDGERPGLFIEIPYRDDQSPDS